jgi:hypothetical protein
MAVAARAEAEPSLEERRLEDKAVLKAARQRELYVDGRWREKEAAKEALLEKLGPAEELVRELSYSAPSAQSRRAAQLLGEVSDDRDVHAEAERALDALQSEYAGLREHCTILEVERQTQSERVDWAKRAVRDAGVAVLLEKGIAATLIARRNVKRGAVADDTDMLRALPLGAFPKDQEFWYADNAPVTPMENPRAPAFRLALERYLAGDTDDLPDVE